MSHDDESAPYRVGKGKPPKEHQFKKGQPSPNRKGRPKGSTRQSQLQRMLKKKIWVTDPDGKRVQKPVDEVIDHRLIETAVKNGDLKAIKLIKELVIMDKRFERTKQLTAEEIRQKLSDEEDQRRVSEKLKQSIADLFSLVEQLKR